MPPSFGGGGLRLPLPPPPLLASPPLSSSPLPRLAVSRRLASRALSLGRSFHWSGVVPPCDGYVWRPMVSPQPNGPHGDSRSVLLRVDALVIRSGGWGGGCNKVVKVWWVVEVRPAVVDGCVSGASWGVFGSGSSGAIVGGVPVAAQVQFVSLCLSLF
ncbi:hypothetical protein RHGRI_001267 [Rhododendron griersonianum]|uniref:Uncharacterized protein n=1 Tax=Rhododendron griersonianum TaxID=479676 RepID=A0AAV6LK08_9ERIC|nr:hypothetical protein RHGRI_001267 [Rhododendron griersonianum]